MNNVRKYRKQQKLSQLELAKEIGVARQTINLIENAKYKGKAGLIEEAKEAEDGALKTSEYAVYSSLKDNPRLSFDDLSKATKVSRRTVARSVSSLTEKGYIERGGSTGRGGYWVILK